jgi:type II secretory pathway component GspD/PulD (secretin)
MKQLFTLLVLCLAALTAQADSIATIQLHNRPAADIIPLVKPMLGPGDAISGQGFQVSLRAPTDTQAQIKQMISALDTAAKMLLISVFQGNQRDLRALSVEGNFQAGGDNGSVSIGSSKERGRGGDVSFSTRNASGGANVISTRGRLQDNPIHQLRVSEGSEGYIETGESIPYFSGAQWLAPGAVVGGIDYKDVTTGFYVLPRIHGDQVTLQVSPFKQSLSNTRGGDINTQSARTTITGRLGEWLSIGGTTEQTQQSRSNIGSYSSTQGRNEESIWIKADLSP